MHTEVAQDQKILEEIIQRVGTAHLDLAESVGWLAERASQFKLHRDQTGAGLGTFEAVEVLAFRHKGKTGAVAHTPGNSPDRHQNTWLRLRTSVIAGRGPVRSY